MQVFVLQESNGANKEGPKHLEMTIICKKQNIINWMTNMDLDYTFRNKIHEYSFQSTNTIQNGYSK